MSSRQVEFDPFLFLDTVEGTNDPRCLEILHLQLKRLDPDVALITRLLSVDGKNRASQQNETGSLPLHSACGNLENLTVELLNLLLSSYPESVSHANQFGLLPLHKAVLKYENEDSLPSIRKLIELYPEAVRKPTKDGRLPLHMSLSDPKITSFKVVQILVDEYPEALQHADKYGHCPLHKAASKAHIDPGIVGYLLERNEKIAYLKDNNG